MTTTRSIHGHEIIQLIHEADPPLSRTDLIATVAKRFGPEARFHACVAENMNLDELLAFLADRGKVVKLNGRLRTDVGLMCDHE